MTYLQLSKLHPGDEIYWNDPDEGTCSRYYKIKNIELVPESQVALIQDEDGSYLECYFRELE